MKKYTLFILSFLFFSTIAFGQLDDNLLKQNWKVGKINKINSFEILRIEGKNDMSGVTNVGYKSLDQLIAKVKIDSEKQMWTKEKEAEKIKIYEDIAQGGVIDLYLKRLSIGAANTEMFTLIIKDSNEEELYREELDDSIPNPEGSYWWNYAGIYIPKKIKGKIYIYIIDKLNSENPRFKFEINI